MIIRRGRPLANGDPEGPASCKWSFGGAGRQILGNLNRAFWAWNWYESVISVFRVCFSSSKIVLRKIKEMARMNFWKKFKRPLTFPPHFRKVTLQFFSEIHDWSIVYNGKNLQLKFLDWKWPPPPHWHFSKKSSNLVAGSFPNRFPDFCPKIQHSRVVTQNIFVK